jgi:DNA-binding transcriptional MerR regulator
MPDDPYSLSDLARLADVTPRTIRYYVAQGLLPAPEAAGPSTRYGEGHLARLRLIKRLQRDHLPLAGIRVRLERMGDEEVQAYLDVTASVAPDPSQDGGDTLTYVRSLMAKSGVSPRSRDRAAESVARYGAAPALRQTVPGLAALHALKPPTEAPPGGHFRDPSAEQAAGPAAEPAAAPIPSRSAAGDRSTWERLALSADVELHVRRPLDRLANKRVDQLIRIARELFDEEP